MPTEVDARSLPLVREPLRRSRPHLGALAAAAALAIVAGACDDDDGVTDPTNELPTNVLYVQSNVPAANMNSVLAYRRAADGSLTPLSGSPFLTGGAGVGNPMQILGPQDVDQNMVVDRGRRLLFVVNGGSNTIAVMRINSDGSLAPVAGSPFSSGGIDPSSVGIAGDRLYVVNKAMDPAQNGGTGTPNYTGFTIGDDGRLTPIPSSTVTSVPGASPSQAHIAPGNSLVFGADFLAPTAPTPAGSLRAFRIGTDGALTAVPGTPMEIPGPTPMSRMALGLWAHPTQRVLYVGFTLQDKLGVYDYATDGTLTFRTTAANSGKAICWILVNPSGSTIYTTNTLTNSLSRYDAASPQAPVERQHLVLREPGPTFTFMGMQVPTSQDFQEALSPDGKFLYVVSQHANPDFTAPNGNKLHTISIAADGTLSETVAPLQLPVATTTRPQGVIVF
ncbi:MAG TPA: beta-propeller fold lactonase family protein [Gemmatimonadaceae bacterium]|nr:beta-propeller fold lactonase family protein [Gemmatimonadaceae bacterium]